MICKVMVVEDERELSDAISVFLKHYGYDVEQAFDGNTAIGLFEEFKPHIVVLDCMLPDIHGMRLCKRFRNLGEVGIIFLSALSSKENIMSGFRQGADDYITKPFDLDILLARVEALHNRLGIDSGSGQDAVQEIMFDSYENKVYTRDKLVVLTPTEFKIMHYLHKTKRFVKASELVEHLYTHQAAVDQTRIVSVHVAKIRKKLQSEEITWIELESKYREGYKMVRY